VTDAGGMTDETSVVVSVSANNDGPSAGGPYSGTTTETAPVTGTVNGTDPDLGDVLSYSIGSTPGYGTASVNAGSGVWTYEPVNRNATYVVTFTVDVTDLALNVAAGVVTVTVNAVSEAPVIGGPYSGSTTEDAATTGTVTASDPEGGVLSYAVVDQPAAGYGTGSVDANTGVWTYQPVNRTTSYVATFTVKATDEDGLASTTSVSVTVTADNDGPSAGGPYSGSTTETAATTGTVVGTDPDVNDSLSYGILSQPGTGFGTASINAGTGVWTYQPVNRTLSYAATFVVRVTDGGSNTATAEVVVSVTATNQTPNAGPDVHPSTNEDTPATGTVAATDADWDAALTYSISVQPPVDYGTASINNGGVWTYTPANKTSSYLASFTVNVTDGYASDTMIVFMTVIADNDAPVNPVISPASPTTDEFTTLNGSITASDPENQPLVYSVHNQPPAGFGTATINPISGAWSYTPSNRISTYTATFTVMITDGVKYITTPVTITVNASNQAPAAGGPYSGSTNEYATTTGSITATDPDLGDSLVYAIGNQPAAGYGTASVTPSGTWTFVPDNRNGLYISSFTVVVTDLANNTASALVIVTVTADSELPVISGSYIHNISEFQTATGTISASDPEGTAVTYTIQTGSGPVIGTATIGMTTGYYQYLPENRMSSYSVSFTVIVTDGDGLTSSTPVTINVSANNNPPVASGTIDVATDENTPITGTISASDPDFGDTIGFSMLTSPAAGYGTASVDPISGIWSYMPANRTATYTATFVVKTTDSGGNFATSQVNVTVTTINDPPVVTTPYNRSTDEDTAITGTIAASDPEGVILTYSVTSSPATGYGTATVNSSGEWAYSPSNRMATYTTSFVVTVSDGVTPVTSTVIVDVDANNDAPTVGGPYSASTPETSPVTGTISANDIDLGDSLVYSIAAQPLTGFGTASIDASGMWTYVPVNHNTTYTATFVVGVTDQASNQSTTSVVVTVNAVSEPPVITGSPYSASTNETTPITGTITATDPEEQALAYAIQSQVPSGYGTASVHGLTGVWTYTPANRTVDYVTSFTVTVTDPDGMVATATVNINVTATNQTPNAGGPYAGTTNEMSSTTGTIGATDADVNDTLAYTVISQPTAGYGSASIQSGTGIWTYIPVNRNASYTATFVVRVSDLALASSTAQVVITVSGDNDAPTYDQPLVNQMVEADSALTYTFSANTFSDIDYADALSYSATVTTGLWPAWLTFDGNTRTFTGTPTNADEGTITIRVTATDLLGSTANGLFNIVVKPFNHIPVVSNAIPDQIATEDAAFTFAFATDTFDAADDGQSLSYVARKSDGSSLPAWLSFNGISRTFSGTPANGDVGTVSISVVATDDGFPNKSATDTFMVTVLNTNDAPTVANIISDQAAVEDTVFNYQFPSNTFFDMDLGDSLTYSAVMQYQGTAWLTFSSATRSFSGTPTNSDVGNQSTTVTVRATDLSGAWVETTFHINVTNVNDAPTIISTPVTTATEDSVYTYLVVAQDIDPGVNILTINAISKPAWLTLYDNGNGTATLTGTPLNGDVGTVNVLLSVSDQFNAATTQSFAITVINSNDAPTVVQPIPDQYGNDGTAFNFTFDLATFNDVDATNTLIYTATQPGGVPLPSWLTTYPNGTTARTFSGTPGPGDVGSFTVVVTASDTFGGTASTTFVIWIDVDVNETPVNHIPGAMTTLEDTNVTFAATSANAVWISDDAGTNPVKVTLIGSNGTVSLSGTTGLDFSCSGCKGDGTNDVEMTFTGSISNINSMMDGMAFTPLQDYNGLGVIQLTTNDQGFIGVGGPKAATSYISVNVTPVNDPPSFTKGIDPTATEDGGQVTLANWATNIKKGPQSLSNEDAQIVTFDVVGNTNPGLFQVSPQISSTGTLTFTPKPNMTGLAMISVVLKDNGGTANGGQDTSPVQTFQIRIILGQQPPIAVNDTAATTQDVPITIPVMDNDSDPNGDTLSFLALTVPAHGSVTYDSGSTLRYTPAAYYIGTDSFLYTISDGHGNISVATVSLTISAPEIEVGPTGGTLTYVDPLGNPTTVTVPVSALEETITLRYTALANPSKPHYGYKYGGTAFKLEVFKNGILQPGYQFNQPLILQMGYDDIELTGLVEATLRLFYLNSGGNWIDAATTCTPSACLYEKDLDNNLITIGVQHLTEFALFGVPIYQIFLPFISTDQ